MLLRSKSLKLEGFLAITLITFSIRFKLGFRLGFFKILITGPVKKNKKTCQ